MDSGEIVKHKMQVHGGPKSEEFFRECISKPGEAPHAHSHSQVLPFNIAGRNMVGVRVARHDTCTSTAAPSRAVPSRILPWRTRIELFEDGMVNFACKRIF